MWQWSKAQLVFVFKAQSSKRRTQAVRISIITRRHIFKTISWKCDKSIRQSSGQKRSNTINYRLLKADFLNWANHLKHSEQTQHWQVCIIHAPHTHTLLLQSLKNRDEAAGNLFLLVKTRRGTIWRIIHSKKKKKKLQCRYSYQKVPLQGRLHFKQVFLCAVVLDTCDWVNS